MDGKGNRNSQSLEEHKRFWKTYIKHKIMDFEEKQWKEEIKDKSKLKNYILVKIRLNLKSI